MAAPTGGGSGDDFQVPKGYYGAGHAQAKDLFQGDDEAKANAFEEPAAAAAAADSPPLAKRKIKAKKGNVLLVGEGNFSFAEVFSERMLRCLVNEELAELELKVIEPILK